MDKCCIEGCEKEAVTVIKSWQGIFTGRKDGMHLVNFPMCEKHKNLARGEVNTERLRVANPHIKGIL